MTTIAPAPFSADTLDDAPLWVEVEPGFWVGNAVGRFLGTVEAREGRFAAYDSTRALIGTFAELTHAHAAVSTPH